MIWATLMIVGQPCLIGYVTSRYSLVTSTAFGGPHRFDLYTNKSFALILIGLDAKRDVPRRSRKRIRYAVEKNCAPMAVTLTQTKDQMLFVHYARCCDRLDFAREEKRLGVSVSKRLQLFVPAEKMDIDVGEGEFMVQSHARSKSFFG